MFIFRIFGFILIAAALVALGADVLHSLQAGHIEIQSLTEAWASIHVESLNTFNGWLADSSVGNTITKIMGYPAWAVLGVIGIVIAGLLALVSRNHY